ncbi:MAG: hypothetical protein LLG02_15715 [Pelosinus sp.]|nr:hypothetical protein [Pelosinus sp.]
MKLSRITIILAILCLGLFTSPASANGIDWQAGFVEADGHGFASASAVTSAQANALARRAAMSDAFRNLLDVITRVHIDKQTTVGNLMTNSVETKILGFVSGAAVKSQQRLSDGSYRVTLRVPLYGANGIQAIIPQVSPAVEPFNAELTQIVLEKAGDSAEITGDVSINLNWYRGRKDFIGANDKVDLDLGCFWELKNGQKSAIDSLNSSFGDFNQAPYIHLDKDDRSGRALSGENLKINGMKQSEFKRILIYSYIYAGVAKFSEIDGFITIKQPGKPDIIVKLDADNNNERTCAIAAIESDANGKWKVTRIVQYFDTRDAMDQAFNWGFTWKSGTKD